MIQSLRKNAAVIMWIVIIAFIATIVFAWGMDLSSNRRGKSVIGKVNGKEIPIQAFERMVSAEREKERERYAGAEVPANQSRMVPRQVWETEVSRILLREALNKMKIGASTEEVFEYIKKNPPPEVYSAKQFQTDSVFDTTKFISFLNNPAVYENEGMLALEKYTREFLVPMQTLRALLMLQEFPTKTEIAHEYRNSVEKTVFEYAKVNIGSIQADKVADNAVTAYYQAHQDSFVTEEQVELYFVKIPKVATPADEKTAYEEMVALREKIRAGDSSSFAEEAKLESDDEGTAVQGGALGWISQGTMVPEFEAVAFSLKPLELSMPVKTRFGYHIIFVEQREKKDGKEQAKVRHILRKIVPSGETMDKLNALADSVHAIIATDGILKVSQKAPSVQVDSTGLFKRGDMMPRAGYVSGAASFAFMRTENELSDLLENEQGFFIFQIKQKIKKGTLPFAAAKDSITKILTDANRREKAKSYFESFLQKVTDKNAVAQFSKQDSLIISGVTDTVGRAQYIPQVGFNNKPVAAAFVLPVGKVSGIIEGAEAFFVVKPLWHKTAGDTVPWGTQEVTAIQKKLISANAEKNYYDWYLHYKSTAKIVDEVNQFYVD
jgi:peptidyl-prolyl cis-trans isomerase D